MIVDKPWSVSELNLQAKNLLEQNFSFVWVKGEISNLMQPKSGHLYFTIKDQNAQISCVWLKYLHTANTCKIANGKLWALKGKISIYQERGSYQLIVNYAEEYGLGEKQLLLEQKRQELIKKGWLESIHKKKLPKIPSKIALITSGTGAAIQDMLKVAKLRMPAIKIVIIPCIVQGNNAAKSISAAIELANKHNIADVLVVGRGGGSIEDLWAYNEDPVINAIFHSKIPVVTGIGHESDHTLSELVADLRAATPSAAIELITPEQHELVQKIDIVRALIQRKMLTKHKESLLHLRILKSKCLSPSEQIKLKHNQLQQFQEKLYMSFFQQQYNKQQKLLLIKQKLSSPKIEIMQEKLTQAHNSIKKNLQTKIIFESQKLILIKKNLQAVDPTQILTKGFAIIEDDNNNVINKDSKIKIGDKIKISTSDKQIITKIEEIILKSD